MMLMLMIVWLAQHRTRKLLPHQSEARCHSHRSHHSFINMHSFIFSFMIMHAYASPMCMATCNWQVYMYMHRHAYCIFFYSLLSSSSSSSSSSFFFSFLLFLLLCCRSLMCSSRDSVLGGVYKAAAFVDGSVRRGCHIGRSVRWRWGRGYAWRCRVT